MINKKDLELKILLRESHIQQLNLKVDKLEKENERLKADYQQANDIIVEQSKEIENLKYIIRSVSSSIHHELYGHILKNDEDSWNLEYYSNNKLDYRKLLIGLLKDYENRLKEGIYYDNES